MWHASKQIDELGGEWGYQVFIHRAWNFHCPFQSPTFYEPLSQIATLMREAHLIRALRETGTPLPLCGSVTVATTVFRSLFLAEDAVVPSPKDGESAIGNHAWRILAAEADALVFQSTWSTWPGSPHIGRIPVGYLERYTTEMWGSRVVDAGPLASTVEQIWESLDESSLLRELWSRRRPMELVPLTYRAATVFGWWETYSFDAPSVAEFCWLATRSGLRIASACVRFDQMPDGAKNLVVLDLFVWPTYRRQGYGEQLLLRVMSRGKKRGCSRVEVLSYDADNVNGTNRTTGFLEHQRFDVAYEPEAQVVLTGSALL